MKWILILLIFSSCTLSKCHDEKACTFFEEQLSITKKAIEGEQVDVGQINNAILFFENITSISSESSGNYLGRFSPIKEDYKRWKSWYDKNKHQLYWDGKSEKVKLRE